MPSELAKTHEAVQIRRVKCGRATLKALQASGATKLPREPSTTAACSHDLAAGHPRRRRIDTGALRLHQRDTVHRIICCSASANAGSCMLPTRRDHPTHTGETPGKDVRGALIDAFNAWLKIPPEKVTQIKSIISRLHNASLLVDDIEDGSQLRRGKPVAHAIFGVPYTLNAANYAYFVALEECHRLGSPEALSVFVEELLNLHRGQGQDIVLSLIHI